MSTSPTSSPPHAVARAAAIVLFAASIAAAGPAATVPWAGPDGEPLPFSDPLQVEEFLVSAAVVERRELATGTSKPVKLLLERDGVRAHAIFRTVDVRGFNINQQARHDSLLTDSYLHEVAAYRLARLLGLDEVPPTVLRTIDGRDGSVQLWIENARTEEEMNGRGETPSNPFAWVMQQRMILVWDSLISNWDRNTTNILVDRGERIWWVDHTRSFRRGTGFDHLEQVTVCERRLWQALTAADDEQLKATLAPLLEGAQLVALVKRRRMLVRHLEQRIAAEGEAGVLYDLADAELLLAAARARGDLPAS